MMTIEAIDVFCGVGGLSFGLKNAGINVIMGIDNDSQCHYAFEQNVNAEFMLKDVRAIKSAAIAAKFSEGAVRLIAGCAPCQRYSSLTNKEGARAGRWRLLKKFADIVFDIRPELITMENVPNVVRAKEFQGFVKGLRDRGYSVSYEVIRCSDFGVPQDRRRLVLLASNLHEVNSLGETCKDYSTVRDAIGRLPEISAGEVCGVDSLHRSAKLTATNLARIRNSKEGGSWKDWPEGLRLECHKKSTGKSYTPVYGRMSWNKPAPTITTRAYNYGSGRFGHPEQDRCISLREAAVLQSFPVDYQFFENAEDITFSAAGRMIGNAVPPRLGHAIGLGLSMGLSRID